MVCGIVFDGSSSRGLVLWFVSLLLLVERKGGGWSSGFCGCGGGVEGGVGSKRTTRQCFETEDAEE